MFSRFHKSFIGGRTNLVRWLLSLVNYLTKRDRDLLNALDLHRTVKNACKSIKMSYPSAKYRLWVIREKFKGAEVFLKEIRKFKRSSNLALKVLTPK